MLRLGNEEKKSGILDLYADELKIVVYMFRKFVQKIKKILDKFMKTCPSFVHNLGMFLKAEKEAEMIIHGLLVSPLLQSLFFDE